MDQSLYNFWKNYETVISWGYRISGARAASVNRSTPPTFIQTTEINPSPKSIYQDLCSSSESVDIDLEYLNFSKITLEHQKQIENEKRKVDKEYGLCNSPTSENESVKSTFMEKKNSKDIYGSSVEEIEDLENKLQSEFNTFCIVKKPVLWPGMAFNISVPEPALHLDLRKLTHPFSE